MSNSYANQQMNEISYLMEDLQNLIKSIFESSKVIELPMEFIESKVQTYREHLLSQFQHNSNLIKNFSFLPCQLERISWEKNENMYPSVCYALGFQPSLIHNEEKEISRKKFKSRRSWYLFKQGIHSKRSFLNLGFHQRQSFYHEIHKCIEFSIKAIWQEGFIFDAFQMDAFLSYMIPSLTESEQVIQAQYSILYHENELKILKCNEFQVRNQKIWKHMNQSMEYYQYGKFTQALNCLSKTLEFFPIYIEDPLLSNIFVHRTRCWIQLHDYVQAEKDCYLAIQLNSLNVSAYTCLGQIMEEKPKRSYSMALDAYLTAYYLHPSSKDPLVSMKVQELCKLVCESSMNFAYNRLRGVYDYEEYGNRLWKRWESVRLPKNPWLIDSYFNILDEKSKWNVCLPSRDLTIEERHAKSIELLTEESAFERVLTLQKEKRYSKALKECYQLLYRINQTNPSKGRSKKEFLKSKNPDHLLSRHQIYVLYNLFASYLSIAGELQYTILALDMSREYAEETCIYSDFKSALALYEFGQLDDAIEMLEILVYQAPDMGEIYLLRGQILIEIHQSTGDFSLALKELQKSIELLDSTRYIYAVASSTFAMTLYKSGQMLKAMKLMNSIIQLHPTCIEAHLMYAELWMLHGNPCHAMKLFHKVSMIYPTCPLPYVQASRLYLSMKNVMEAKKHLNYALELSPIEADANVELCQLALMTNQSKRLIDHFFNESIQKAQYFPQFEELYTLKTMYQTRQFLEKQFERSLTFSIGLDDTENLFQNLIKERKDQERIVQRSKRKRRKIPRLPFRNPYKIKRPLKRHEIEKCRQVFYKKRIERLKQLEKESLKYNKRFDLSL